MQTITQMQTVLNMYEQKISARKYAQKNKRKMLYHGVLHIGTMNL